MGVQGTVAAESDRPLPLDRLHFPVASTADKIKPFEGYVVMPHNVRSPQETGRYLEAVKVLAACDEGERVFVRFHRSGSTAWVQSDWLVDQ